MASELTTLEIKARDQFNAFIRLRDRDKPCIYCGGGQHEPNAAHYFTKNRFSGYMFNENNVFGACAVCNNLDNQEAFRANMIFRIGIEAVEKLEAGANSNRFRKFARYELKEIAEIYKLKIKELNAD